MARGKKSKTSGSCFFAKVLRGFFEEMEEEKKKQKNKKKRRKLRGRLLRDMNDLYRGFGKRYNDDDDEDEDVEDEENEEDGEDGEDDEEEDEDDEDDDEDDDEEDADDSGRGCGIAGRNAKGPADPIEMMSGLGRYFNASDYDQDYEE